MADQPINGLPKKTTVADTDSLLMIGTSEEYQIDYGKLADALLNKLTSKTFTLDQGIKTLIAALNELNSNTSFKLINDLTAYDGIELLDGGYYKSKRNCYLYASIKVLKKIIGGNYKDVISGNPTPLKYNTNGNIRIPCAIYSKNNSNTMYAYIYSAGYSSNIVLYPTKDIEINTEINIYIQYLI